MGGSWVNQNKDGVHGNLTFQFDYHCLIGFLLFLEGYVDVRGFYNHISSGLNLFQAVDTLQFSFYC